jgi:hypothetical protein
MRRCSSAKFALCHGRLSFDRISIPAGGPGDQGANHASGEHRRVNPQANGASAMENVVSQIFEPVLVLSIATLFSVSVLADMTAKPAASAKPCAQVASVMAVKHLV